jgi:hypothetical protein
LPDFLDCLTDQARAEWYVLMQNLGMAYGQRKKMLEINTKLEGIEEIDHILRQQPGEDKSDANS